MNCLRDTNLCLNHVCCLSTKFYANKKLSPAGQMSPLYGGQISHMAYPVSVCIGLTSADKKQEMSVQRNTCVSFPLLFSLDIKFLCILKKSQSIITCYNIYPCFSQRFSIDHHQNTSVYVTQNTVSLRKSKYDVRS